MFWLREIAGVMLPLAACLGIWRVFATKTGEWRHSLALSTVAMGVLVALGTEVLSLLNGVTIAGYLTLYAAYGVGLVLVSGRLRKSGHVTPDLPWYWLRDPWVVISVAISGVLLMLAIVSPPNNWDSMTYHMARVAHWAAQGNVAYYATHIDRQLFLQPWAEYAILQGYVLSGSDVWANLVQWAAMVVTLVMVSLLARNLDLGRSGQLTAAIIVLTLPMGITEATTTQNDYVATMWVAILAVLISHQHRFSRGSTAALMIGAVVGLAMMTKATSYFFIAPLLLWWLVSRVERKPAVIARAVLAVALPALLLSSPGFTRNIETFSNPFGPPLPDFVNSPIGPQATAENLVRHAALQFGVPSAAVNHLVTNIARMSASTVGLNLDRPGSTFPPGTRFNVTFGYREDDAQAFAATALLAIAVPVLFLTRRRARRPHWKALAPLFACALAGTVLLDTYLRWNPWNGRYLLPFFVLTAVVTAAALDRVGRRYRGLVLTALVGASLLWVFGSDLRPLVGPNSVLLTSRQDQYFAARPELRVPYLQAASYVRSTGATRVGYIAAGDDWEYPLWVLLNNSGHKVTLQSIEVTNASRRYEGLSPDVVICTKPCSPPSDASLWSAHRFGYVSVWKKQS